MKCSICNKEYSDKVLRIHRISCLKKKKAGEKERAGAKKKELENLKSVATDMGIKFAYNIGIEALNAKVQEALDSKEDEEE